MSNSTNYKIQKYTYKMNYAKSKKEKELYAAKLRQYKGQVGGTTPEPLKLKDLPEKITTESSKGFLENLFSDLTDYTNKQLDNNAEQISELSKLLEDLKRKIEELCKKGECEDKAGELVKLEKSLKEILELVREKAGDQGKTISEQSSKISTKVEEIKSKIEGLKAPCPTPNPSQKEAEVKEQLVNGEPGEEVVAPPKEEGTQSRKFPPVDTSGRVVTTESGPDRTSQQGHKGGRKVGGKRRLKY